VLRYDWLEGPLDVAAFERELASHCQGPMTAEDLTTRIFALVATACQGWVRVQIVSEVPGATGKLTLGAKRSR